MSLDFIRLMVYEVHMNKKLLAAMAAVIGENGPCTHQEIMTLARIGDSTTTSGLSELLASGQVERAGRRRECIGSGSPRLLWRLVEGIDWRPEAVEEYHRKPTEQERFWSNVDKNGPTKPHMPTPCWIWTAGRHDFGYGHFYRKGAAFGTGAHRVSWEYATGQPPPRGLHVLHHCDNPPCVRPEHLYVGTDRDNRMDALRRGRDNTARGDANGSRTRPDRRARAEGHGNAKLTWAIVDEIRSMYVAGTRQKDIAGKFGVSSATVHAVVHNLRWVRNG